MIHTTSQPAERVLLTEEGWDSLHEELLRLREWVAAEADARRELAHSAEPGSLTSDYLQSGIAPLDRRIARLEEVLADAVRVDATDQEAGTVGVGSRVTVLWEDGAEDTYVIVGPPEVEPNEGRISYESPVGHALVGAHEGQQIAARTPGGVLRLRVLNVESTSRTRSAARS